MVITIGLGMAMLAIYLIVMGLSRLAGFKLPSWLVGLWEIVTGILLLIGR